MQVRSLGVQKEHKSFPTEPDAVCATAYSKQTCRRRTAFQWLPLNQAFISVLFLLGCSQPDLERIKNDLERNNRGCRVLSVLPGEGDSDNVYLHVRYSCGTWKAETTLLYQRTNGDWQPSPSTSLALARPRAVQRQAGDAEPFRITSEITAPVLVKRVEPRFPDQLRATTRHGGVIVMEAVVTSVGDVREVRVIKGQDNPAVSEVVAALKQWKFRPAERQGRAVDVFYHVSVNIDVR